MTTARGGAHFPSSVDRLTMKGTPADDAYICTADRTFTLRTITVSNSMLFLRPDTTTNDLYIQDTCHEILELTPSVPRLARVEKLLRETSWSGMQGTKRAREGDEDESAAGRNKSRKRYTRAQMQSVIQASDVELDAGLAERNVIEVDGTFLLVSPIRDAHPPRHSKAIYFSYLQDTSSHSSRRPYHYSPSTPSTHSPTQPPTDRRARPVERPLVPSWITWKQSTRSIGRSRVPSCVCVGICRTERRQCGRRI